MHQEAREILIQTARRRMPAMRGEAIRSIGIGGDPKTLDALMAIYNAGGPDVKGEVLQAWLIAGHKEAVYQVALNAKTEEEANQAIRLLGVMGGADELRKLGDKPNAASGLVEAYALSGDLASLRKIAEGSGDRSRAHRRHPQDRPDRQRCRARRAARYLFAQYRMQKSRTLRCRAC